MASYRQFLARPGFAQRLRNFFHPEDAVDRKFSSGDGERDGIYTLPKRVFTRGRFEVGEIPGRINHGIPTIALADFRTPNRGLLANRSAFLGRRG